MDPKHVVIDYIDTEYDEKLNDELMKWKNNAVNRDYESSINSLSRSNSDSDHSGSQYSRNSMRRQKLDADNATCKLLSVYINCKKSMYMHIYQVGKIKTIIMTGGSCILTIASIAIAPSFAATLLVVFFLITMNLLSCGLLITVICSNIYTNSLLALRVANVYDKLMSEVENMANHKYCEIDDKLSNIEYKLNELSNHFIIYIPLVVKRCHRIVYFINIFDVFKKIKTCKKRTSLKLATIHREITMVMKNTNNDLSSGEKNQMHYLGGIKEGTKKEKMDVENAFTYLCELLTIEHIQAVEYFENDYGLCRSPGEFVGHHKTNMMIDEYLQSVMLQV